MMIKLFFTSFQVRFLRNLDEKIILLFFDYVGQRFEMIPVLFWSKLHLLT